MSLVQELLDKPLEFGKKYPLQPRTYAGPSETRKEKRTQDDTFFQVRGEERICWFAFKPTTMKDFGPGAYALDVCRYPKPGYEPMYWLDWDANQVFRTVLRPSRKFQNEDFKTEYGVRMFRDTVENILDQAEQEEVFNHRLSVLANLENLRPRIFFTAAVNGCSVFIEGTEEQPVVYHANAMGHLMGFDEVDSARLFQRLRAEKINHMEKRYREFSASHKKGPRGPGSFTVKPPGEVNPSHYFAAVQDQRFQQWFAEEAHAIADKWVQDTERTRYFWTSLKDLKLEEGIGAVFGVETNGKWQFFYQKLVFVTVLRDDALIGSDWKRVSSWHTFACEKFWPDGGGRFDLG